MASFEAKTGWDRLRVIQKKKIYHSDYFLLDQEYKIKKKKSKKIQKIKKHHYGFFSIQNGLGEAEKERKKKFIILINS